MKYKSTCNYFLHMIFKFEDFYCFGATILVTWLYLWYFRYYLICRVTSNVKILLALACDVLGVTLRLALLSGTGTRLWRVLWRVSSWLLQLAGWQSSRLWSMLLLWHNWPVPQCYLGPWYGIEFQVCFSLSMVNAMFRALLCRVRL